MEEEKIEAPEETTETEGSTPKDLKKIGWISEQIIKSPLRAIFIMLMIAISTMGSITGFMYAQSNNQIKENKAIWAEIIVEKKAEIVELKKEKEALMVEWKDCLVDKTNKITRMDEITRTKKKKN